MFAIERSETTGPRGGKRRGYCLAWRGSGFPPFGMGRRSGWYLRRPDAEDRARVMNEAWRRDLARPVRDAVRMGDGAFLVRLVDPAGAVHWLGTHGATPDGLGAVRFNNRQAAAGSLAHYSGNGDAFWNSERASRERMRERFRGWRGEVLADAELQGVRTDA